MESLSRSVAFLDQGFLKQWKLPAQFPVDFFFCDSSFSAMISKYLSTEYVFLSFIVLL